MSESRSVVLYSRSRCHLCDEARRVIEAERARAEFPFREVLVDDVEELERAYGTRVPVVTVDGREEFEFAVDPVRLRALVRA
jgi:glutaredoxin